MAASNGNLGALKNLIKTSDYSVTQLDEDGNAAIHCAALNGYLTIVKYLIEECQVDHTTLNANKCSPLHLAAARGNLDLMEYLVKEKDLDPLSPEIYGWTPVHYATAAGHLEVVQMLSESPDTRQHLMENTLSYKSIEYNIAHIAINEGHINITEYFMSVNASIEDSLSLLLSVHHFSIMKYLSETFKYTQLSKQCALFTAAAAGKVDSVKCLLDSHSCDPSLRNDLGNTPLHVAAAYGQLNVVKYLIE